MRTSSQRVHNIQTFLQKIKRIIVDFEKTIDNTMDIYIAQWPVLIHSTAYFKNTKSAEKKEIHKQSKNELNGWSKQNVILTLIH